ncbi:hypothetical protein BHM03_00015701 [Ensete ventricosum]|nr:hypothetical protein BHM03_00015701 [Ensete ventricosum]
MMATVAIDEDDSGNHREMAAVAIEKMAVATTKEDGSSSNKGGWQRSLEERYPRPLLEGIGPGSITCFLCKPLGAPPCGDSGEPWKGTRTTLAGSERSRSARSSPGGLMEVVEEPTESSASPHGEMKDEDRVYVAVEKDVREGRANFVWVLQNTAEERKITVVHVHRPAQKIPTALGWFPTNQLEEQEVTAYRNIERKKMHKCVDEYLNMCASVKVMFAAPQLSSVQKAEKLVIERDDVGKGLVELIALHGITKLVMGAAADRYYSRYAWQMQILHFIIRFLNLSTKKEITSSSEFFERFMLRQPLGPFQLEIYDKNHRRMKAPKSKTALAVQEHADPSCKIWFICKGNLICTR